VLKEIQSLGSSSKFLSYLSDAELQTLSDGLKEVRCGSGQALIETGEKNIATYIVLEGQIEIFVVTQLGIEQTLDRVGPGGLVGEMAIASGGRRHTDARAIEASRLARIPLEIFERLLQEKPELFCYVAELVQTRFRKLQLFKQLTLFFGPVEVFEANFLRQWISELEWLTLKSGETLFKEGELTDSAFFLITGRLRVALTKQSGDEVVIAEVGSGEMIGEMALLAEGKRSATVSALRDCVLVQMSKPVFNKLIDRYPRCLKSINRILVDRLHKTSTSHRPRSQTSSIALLPANPSVPIMEFSRDLATALARYGSVDVLTSDKVNQELHQPGIAQSKENEPTYPGLTQWLNEREESVRSLIYQADTSWSRWTERCVRQTDQLLIVGMAGSDPALGEVETKLSHGGDVGPSPHQILVLMHPSQCDRPRETATWLELRNVEQHHHLRRHSDLHYARLARFLIGESIGLVLGGGVARGYAHIGVIRALEESGITIDMIGGTSMGAWIAGQYAYGYDYEDMIRINSDVFHRSSRDYTLPLFSLLAGRELWRRGSKYLSGVEIEDLWLPYFSVSSNLTRADVEIHKAGSLGWAIRASGSLPGIWPPINSNGELLVDGAVLNNVPIDVMRGTCPGKVIAVDVSSPLDLQENSPYGESLSGWDVLWKRLSPFGSRMELPGIFSIMTRSAELASVRAQQQIVSAGLADLYLRPPVSHFGAMDLQAVREIAEAGLGYTKGMIESWQEEGNDK